MANSDKDYEVVEFEFTVIEADSGSWVFVAKPERECDFEDALQAMKVFIESHEGIDHEIISADVDDVFH